MIKISILFLFILFRFSSLAQTHWTKYPGNPVLELGPALSWDESDIAPNYVIYQDGIYRMWYDGTSTNQSRNVGLAISPDGINWSKYSGNPVFTTGPAGSWDDFRVVLGSIIIKDKTYHMWYAGNDGTRTGSYYKFNIGYATSTDSGVTWIKYPSAVLEPGHTNEWDDYSVTSPWVIVENDTFKLWYDGYRSNEDGIGYAWSLDGINWNKYNDPLTTRSPYMFSDPIMLPSKPWESGYIGFPCILKNDDHYEMWYTGFANSGAMGSQGYATSSNGINWNKFDDNPVMPHGVNNSWESHEVLSAKVYLMNSVYKMWYGGWDGILTKIGYATDSILTDINDNVLQLPSEFNLSPNYPNPYNPTTKINYSIPNRTHVSLKVYDILGSEVRILVNKKQPQGNYEVEFDGSELASGVFFYRLQAGDYIETKKMVLMK